MSREKIKEISDDTEELLEKAEINYNILDNEGCCGSVLLRTGFQDDALEIMQETLNHLKGEKVLVSCAGCYRTFKIDYPELLGEEIEVIHTSQFFHQLIQEGKIQPVLTEDEVTYHDPCHLGRHMGEYEIPRRVIEPYSKLMEMERNREHARCCGAGGGVRSAFPVLSSEIARMRIEDAKSTGAKTLVTCCPFCILNLDSAQPPENDAINVMDLSQFLLIRLNGEG
jgi:Fe-S oxidoreductase